MNGKRYTTEFLAVVVLSALLAAGIHYRTQDKAQLQFGNSHLLSEEILELCKSGSPVSSSKETKLYRFVDEDVSCGVFRDKYWDVITTGNLRYGTVTIARRDTIAEVKEKLKGFRCVLFVDQSDGEYTAEIGGCLVGVKFSGGRVNFIETAHPPQR